MDLCFPHRSGRWLSAHSSDGYLWVRVLGRGLHCADRSKHPALFSERMGLIRVLRLGRWAIKWLSR